MKKALLLLTVGLLLFAGYRWLNPGPEKVIRNRLLELAAAASFQSSATPLSNLANAQMIASFCSQNVEITVDLPGRQAGTVTGRDEVMQGLLASRQAVGSLSVDFYDITVHLSPDGDSATANLTVRARTTGDRDDYIQELRFTFQKTEGDWFITRIQTVKTLTLLLPTP